MSSRSSRCGSRAAVAISRSTMASYPRRIAHNRPHGLHPPRSTLGRGSTANREPIVIARGSSSRSAANSAPSAPNTVRRMMLSVLRELLPRKGPPLRPRRQLTHRLVFDDLLVRGQPAAVERRDEQPALLVVLLAPEREQRAGTEYPAEVAVEVVRDVGTGHEQLLDLGRIADDHGAAEDRDIDGERVAVAVAHLAHPTAGNGEGIGALHESRGRRTWRKRDSRHRAAPSSDGTPAYQPHGTLTYHFVQELRPREV